MLANIIFALSYTALRLIYLPDVKALKSEIRNLNAASRINVLHISCREKEWLKSFERDFDVKELRLLNAAKYYRAVKICIDIAAIVFLAASPTTLLLNSETTPLFLAIGMGLTAAACVFGLVAPQALAIHAVHTVVCYLPNIIEWWVVHYNVNKLDSKLSEIHSTIATKVAADKAFDALTVPKIDIPPAKVILSAGTSLKNVLFGVCMGFAEAIKYMVAPYNKSKIQGIKNHIEAIESLMESNNLQFQAPL